MSVSSANPVASAPPVQKTPDASQDARAADGDYLTPGAGRSIDKDADGDYKPTPATVSSSVQAALTDIKLGG